MITVGRHKARAVEAALGYTKGGKEQVAVLFEILDGDDAGQQITWYGFFSEKTEERTLEALQHCGWEGADIGNLDGVTKNEVQLVVEMEAGDDGNSYPRVRWVNGASAGLALKSRMNDGQRAAFAQRMRGKVLATRQAAGQALPGNGGGRTRKSERHAAPAGVADDAADDDIPF